MATENQSQEMMLAEPAGVARKPVQELSKLDMTDANTILDASKQLADFIKKRKLSVNISGKEYARVEAWQFIFMLADLRYVVSEPEQLNAGVKYLRSLGSKQVEAEEYTYKAQATVFNSANQIVSQGFAIASNKESRLAAYEQYALYSYAQTRALSKAGRSLFAVILAAAGYEPTPAEEMGFAEVVDASTPVGAVAPPPPLALEQGVIPIPLPVTAATPEVHPVSAEPATEKKPRGKAAAAAAAAATPPPPPPAAPAPAPAAPAAVTPPPPAPAAPLPNAAPAAAPAKSELTSAIVQRMLAAVSKDGKGAFDNVVLRIPVYTYTEEVFAELRDGLTQLNFDLVAALAG